MASFELSEATLRSRPGWKWHRYPDDVLPAWIAEMDFDVAEPIHRVMRAMVDEGMYGYEDADLYPSLAEAFAAYMQRRHAWRPDPEYVLPVADLVEALFASVSAFTTRGQGVVVQAPIYPPFLNAIQELGRKVVEHRLVEDGGRFVLDGSSLEALLDEDVPLLFVCNPHNPTGRAFERAELEAIAAAAAERNLVVVADEVHAEVMYPGRTHIPFASLGPRVAERTVTITSATKAYNIPGLRCGLMHFGSSELRERFRAMAPDRLLGKVNRFGMEATRVAWTKCDDWLDAVLDVLRLNRDRLSEFLSAELPEVGYHPPEAGYLAWLDCSRLHLPLPPQEFFLQHARVALTDGAEFGSPGRGHVRFNFATSRPILDEMLRRMADAVRCARSDVR